MLRWKDISSSLFALCSSSSILNARVSISEQGLTKMGFINVSKRVGMMKLLFSIYLIQRELHLSMSSKLKMQGLRYTLLILLAGIKLPKQSVDHWGLYLELIWLNRHGYLELIVLTHKILNATGLSIQISQIVNMLNNFLKHWNRMVLREMSWLMVYYGWRY